MSILFGSLITGSVSVALVTVSSVMVGTVTVDPPVPPVNVGVEALGSPVKSVPLVSKYTSTSRIVWSSSSISRRLSRLSLIDGSARTKSVS